MMAEFKFTEQQYDELNKNVDQFLIDAYINAIAFVIKNQRSDREPSDITRVNPITFVEIPVHNLKELLRKFYITNLAKLQAENSVLREAFKIISTNN